MWVTSRPEALSLPVEAIVEASGGVARPGPLVKDALRQMPRGDRPARVLICALRQRSIREGLAVREQRRRIGEQLIPFLMGQLPTALGRAFDQTCEQVTCTTAQRAAMAKALDAMKARAAATQPG